MGDEVRLTAHAVTADGTWDFIVRLAWLRHDPLVVRMEMPCPDGTSVWEISREMLTYGLGTMVGYYRVVVWPADERRVAVRLCSRTLDSKLTLHLSAAAVARFVAQTIAVVPLGDEDYTRAVDSAIVEILAGSDV